MDTGTRKIGESLPRSQASSVWQLGDGFLAKDLQDGARLPGQTTVRRHRLALILVDLGIIATATGLAAAAFPHRTAGYMCGAVAVLWFLCLAAYRSRDPRVLGAGSDEYKRVVTASLITFGVLFMLGEMLVPGMEHGFFVVAYSAGLGGVLCGRLALRVWLGRQRKTGRCLSRVVVLGEKSDVEHVIGQIQRKSRGAYLVVGAAVLSEETTDLTVDGQQVSVISDVQSLVPSLNTLAPDAVIVAGPVPGGSDFIRDLAWSLEKSGADLVLASGLTNVAANRIYACRAGSLPLFHVQLPRYSGLKHVVKRFLDVVLSGFALVLLLPVFATLAVLIIRDSPGPALFRQERVGRGERTFMMYKFRSMVETAESELAGLEVHNEGAGLLFKLRKDPRVTGVGKWLRRHSLDELPQLWNVFKGDMSLVGPRPPLPTEVAAYEKAVHRRLYVKPGLTGLWQVNGRSELSWKESVRLDLYYVENWSLAGDFMIMLQTLGVLLKPHGAY
ncbi:sugar transferase [Pseudarthrobacter sulfonivorans]|uniref:sugar transferase n=1 Tax=Pseudarthrobacter sulfonivorans TaxID=121292 RepID=UPI002858BAC9|nr:sugar transferase [Pseudarthrobacter sulfonivorans]MDR6414903.1 exopolysaccharide biosynthesis polyprenyl glycosylphosphotransferase [Pseudarthrobacter sulfonivorans]